MEAVAESEILRVEAEQALRTDGISGHVNHVTYKSQPNTDTRFHNHQPGDIVIGRFGLKARQPTLDDFAADALQGDMGLTSPMRPTEVPNRDGMLDDDKPGLDMTMEQVNLIGDYVRLIRRGFPDFSNHVEETITQGDRTFARLTYRGTHRGEVLGVPATGRRVEYAGAAVFRFRDNRIAETWVLGDVWGLVRQLRGGGVAS